MAAQDLGPGVAYRNGVTAAMDKFMRNYPGGITATEVRQELDFLKATIRNQVVTHPITHIDFLIF